MPTYIKKKGKPYTKIKRKNDNLSVKNTVGEKTYDKQNSPTQEQEPAYIGELSDQAQHFARFSSDYSCGVLRCKTFLGTASINDRCLFKVAGLTLESFFPWDKILEAVRSGSHFFLSSCAGTGGKPLTNEAYAALTPPSAAIVLRRAF